MRVTAAADIRQQLLLQTFVDIGLTVVAGIGQEGVNGSENVWQSTQVLKGRLNFQFVFGFWLGCRPTIDIVSTATLA